MAPEQRQRWVLASVTKIRPQNILAFLNAFETFDFSEVSFFKYGPFWFGSIKFVVFDICSF
jgi:hypothetical protein